MNLEGENMVFRAKEPQPTEQEDNPSFIKRHARAIVVGAAAVSIAAVAAIGIGSNQGEGNNGPDDPTPTATGDFTPSPDPTNTEVVIPSISPSETAPEQVTLERMQEITDYDVFMQQPWEDRMILCSWINRDLDSISEAWVHQTGNPNDVYVSNTTIDASAQEKTTWFTYNTIRSALARHENGASSKIEMREVNGCSQYNPDQPTDTYLGNDELIRNTADVTMPGLLARSPNLEMYEVTSQEEPVVNDDGSVSQTFSFTDFEGTSHTTTFVSRHYTDFEGNDAVAHYPID